MNDGKKRIVRVVVYNFIGCIIFILASSFCFFINQMWIPLGYLIGTIFSSINMIILYNFSYYLTKPYANYRFLSFLSYTSRIIVYGIGFVCCLLPQKFGLNIFFWGTCLASYLVGTILVVLIFRK